jgi:hypothetical protein
LPLTCVPASVTLQCDIFDAIARDDVPCLEAALDAAGPLVGRGDGLPLDGTGASPLHACVTYSATKCAEVLLARLPSSALVHARNAEGYTPLHAALYRGDVVLACTLLLHGATLDAVDNDGLTPLQLAAARKRTDGPSISRWVHGWRSELSGWLCGAQGQECVQHAQAGGAELVLRILFFLFQQRSCCLEPSLRPRTRPFPAHNSVEVQTLASPRIALAGMQ